MESNLSFLWNNELYVVLLDVLKHGLDFTLYYSIYCKLLKNTMLVLTKIRQLHEIRY